MIANIIVWGSIAIAAGSVVLIVIKLIREVREERKEQRLEVEELNKKIVEQENVAYDVEPKAIQSGFDVKPIDPFDYYDAEYLQVPFTALVVKEEESPLFPGIVNTVVELEEFCPFCLEHNDEINILRIPPKWEMEFFSQHSFYKHCVHCGSIYEKTSDRKVFIYGKREKNA